MPENKGPLKRHPALQPLSREHHQILVLSQLLRRNAPDYRGLPTDPEGKRGYAIYTYEETLLPHMRREEEQLFARFTAGELGELCSELRREHGLIERAMDQLRERNGPQLVGIMDNLGQLLAMHIRKEERQFFGQVQEALSEEELGQLDL